MEYKEAILHIEGCNKEYIIKKLKSQDGYCGWKLMQF